MPVTRLSLRGRAFVIPEALYQQPTDYAETNHQGNTAWLRHRSS